MSDILLSRIAAQDKDIRFIYRELRGIHGELREHREVLDDHSQQLQGIHGELREHREVLDDHSQQLQEHGRQLRWLHDATAIMLEHFDLQPPTDN